MAVTNDEVSAVLLRYLEARGQPREGDTVRALLASVDRAALLTSRGTYPAHVTCGVVAVRPDGTVLQVHHRGLDRWLLPGGHVEPEDSSLDAAALRELAEETGLSPAGASVVGDGPVDVDAHVVPANPAKGEPEHTHVDFRYLLAVGDAPSAVELQVDEVSAFRWVAVDELPAKLGEQVSQALASEGQGTGTRA